MDKHSPTPWRMEKSPNNSNFWVVRCDTGVSLATAWHEADAALIVEAVNGLDAALAHADECSRDAAAEHAARARAVEDAQREANLRADRLAALVRELADCLEEVDGDAFRALIDRAREAAQ